MSIKLPQIPKMPGIYLMRDATSKIVYIGKAKNLYKRINSYFTSSKDNRFITLMFNQVKNIDFIVCGSEWEAVILEQKLISRIKPKYNVLAKDDKSFPLLYIDVKDTFPKIGVMRLRQRELLKDKNILFFGPFYNIKQLSFLIKWLSRMFKIRQCNYNSQMLLDEGKKYEKKFKSCLYYQTNQCLAPCLKKVSISDYKKEVKNLSLFLSGRYKNLITTLQKNLKHSIEKKDFERAIISRDIIRYLNSLSEKFIFREIKEEDIILKSEDSYMLLQRLKDKLFLQNTPLIIEAIDISNIQGKQPTGSVVRFINGFPDRSEYRKYRIKKVRSIDDYSMIKEVVYRRYKRLLDEKKHLPDLVLIDGGKGHLNVVLDEVKKLNLNKKIDFIALAKKQDEVYIKGSETPIKLGTLPEDNILRYIRDEAHRFAITYHKLLRKKSLFAS